jgi:hypothetical protein
MYQVSVYSGVCVECPQVLCVSEAEAHVLRLVPLYRRFGGTLGYQGGISTPLLLKSD